VHGFIRQDIIHNYHFGSTFNLSLLQIGYRILLGRCEVLKIYSPLITCEALEENLGHEDWVLVDCRFSLQDPDVGFENYKQAHIPGAVYAHLDEDLCGPPLTDKGRHPLPSVEAMISLFGRLGIMKNTQVVVYDDAGEAYASRLWWMLRYMGHSAVALLDGGWNAWQRAGLPIRPGVECNKAVEFKGTPRYDRLVTIDDIAELPILIDSRSPERHRGEIEPIDPKAGHIPGSLNYFYKDNLDDNGLFLSREVLRARIAKMIGDIPAEHVTFYCGSGVTACVNLWAVEYAGLGSARLYVGSWGEWCREPQRPIATG